MSQVKIDPTKAIDLDWTTAKEDWNVYKLEDGTTLKVKLVLRGVMRAKDQYTQAGQPLYAINSISVVRTVKVPKKLMGTPSTNQVGRV